MWSALVSLCASVLVVGLVGLATDLSFSLLPPFLSEGCLSRLLASVGWSTAQTSCGTGSLTGRGGRGTCQVSSAYSTASWPHRLLCTKPTLKGESAGLCSGCFLVTSQCWAVSLRSALKHTVGHFPGKSKL